ncbi:MAG: FAD-dependent monooxygenase [Planctomycetes bacterium]|nr:FAD-dependent monooxygenase [Planctomycetota bacterium]
MAGKREENKITIVGAGLAGALLAARLGQAGFEVDVYEARSDPRGKNHVAGKSINLAISTRGFHALGQVGLADDVMSIATPMRGRMMHSTAGQLQFQAYGVGKDDVIQSVSRSALNMMLIKKADATSNVRFHFSHKCVGADLENGGCEFVVEDKGETVHVEGGLTIGCDGAFSAVRRSMQRLNRFDFSQTYLKHGYKELCIPPAENGTHALEPNALHIWPRRSFMMIALPNEDGSFTCTLFLGFEDKQGPSFSSLTDAERVRAFFERQFPDAVPLMPTLIEDFFDNPTGSLVTVRSAPWYYEDKFALVGDACHAVVPFYGQGANAAFGDCAALGDLLTEDSNSDVGRLLEEYFDRRKIHIDTLADLAISNFVEMRDHTGSQLFLWKKRLERTLHRLFPKAFLPLYSMVTFSRTPYKEAVDRAARQWRFVRRFAQTVGVVVVILIALMLLK